MMRKKERNIFHVYQTQSGLLDYHWKKNNSFVFDVLLYYISFNTHLFIVFLINNFEVNTGFTMLFFSFLFFLSQPIHTCTHIHISKVSPHKFEIHCCINKHEKICCS